MEKIFIGGKEYKVNVTWGGMLKFIEKEKKLKDKIYKRIKKAHPQIEDDDLRKEIELQMGIPNTILMMWSYLKKRWYGLKPFIIKKRMINKVLPYELAKNLKILDQLMSMEDREGKNLH